MLLSSIEFSLEVGEMFTKKLWSADDSVCGPRTAARHSPGGVAQVTTATIVGTVTDPGGAIVPGAQVIARNADTGLTRTVTSNDEGTYRLEFLPVGKYSVEVTFTGFKKALVSDIVLQVNDTVRVDVALTVGQVSETVTIRRVNARGQYQYPEIGRTIQAAEITSSAAG